MPNTEGGFKEGQMSDSVYIYIDLILTRGDVKSPSGTDGLALHQQKPSYSLSTSATAWPASYSGEATKQGRRIHPKCIGTCKGSVYSENAPDRKGAENKHTLVGSIPRRSPAYVLTRQP